MGQYKMKCDICHKNEATIHVQEVIGATKNILNICSECAAEHNIGNGEMGEFNLAEMLYNISSQMLQAHSDNPIAEDADDGGEDESGPACVCGWNTTKFRDGGRLGCPECYNVFAPILVNALRSMHKGSRHMGKRPDKTAGDESVAPPAISLLSLQKELDKCVKSENYERAAEIRDEINELKKRAGNQDKGVPAA
jgi:protein arginine kinase activator